MNDELTGTLVLVHPELKGDPISKQGKVGVITAENFENDYVCVSFGTGEQGYYTHDALLALKRSSAIYADMMRNSTRMATADFKDLFRICLLVDTGLNRDKRAAFELVKNNEVIRSYSVQRVTEKAVFRQDQAINQY